MCHLVNLNVNGRTVRVADIKKDYIENIMSSIYLCKEIDKVVLFGSALEERCKEESDIDIAIFGRCTRNKMNHLKSYNQFVDSVISYGELQDYDMLYFDSSKPHNDIILNDINKGEVLFERI
jgi:predicted nucleotidyltransferase